MHFTPQGKLEDDEKLLPKLWTAEEEEQFFDKNYFTPKLPEPAEGETCVACDWCGTRFNCKTCDGRELCQRCLRIRKQKPTVCIYDNKLYCAQFANKQ